MGLRADLRRGELQRFFHITQDIYCCFTPLPLYLQFHNKMVAVNTGRNGHNAKARRHYPLHVLHEPSPRERLSNNGSVQEIRAIPSAPILGLCQDLLGLRLLLSKLGQLCFRLSRFDPLSLGIHVMTKRDEYHEGGKQDREQESRAPVS